MFFKRHATKPILLSNSIASKVDGFIPPLAEERSYYVDYLTQIIADLNDQPMWDFSLDSEIAKKVAIMTAADKGIKPPYTDREEKLITYLKDNLAGQKIANYGWSIYIDLLNKPAHKIAS